MKRIFPIITVLVLLSLLGIIFFQYLWIKGSLESEEQKFYEHVSMATNQAANDLMEEKGNLMPMMKKNQLLFPSEKLQLEIFKPTITQKYSIDEIRAIIKKAFDKQSLHRIPFEFAIFPLSLVGEEIQSENFYRLYVDSANNRMHVIQLESPGGSLSEGISPQEVLMITVPHAKKLIWRSMTWFIVGATLFTIIIVTAFFLTIRALLKQKKLSEIKSDSSTI